MTQDTKQEEELAEEKYGGNGWSEVEKLVLYRLDKSEQNIGDIKGDIKDLIIKRDKDVTQSRSERTEQFKQMLEGISGIKKQIADDKLEISNREGRLKRLETIVYSILGTFGLGTVGAIVNKIF